MKAMILSNNRPIESSPLSLEEIPIPVPGPREVLVKVHCCAICRTDLHVIEGDLNPKKLPLIPGHQAIGTIHSLGPSAKRFKVGQKIGAAWLGFTCGICPYCLSQKENLCLNPLFTGYDFNGGYAEYMVAHEDYIYPLPQTIEDVLIAPLLCAGIIGYRSLKRSQFFPGGSLGIFGFGSSAHIVIQLALHQEGKVLVVTRAPEHQNFALQLGATWVGATTQGMPELIDSAILFAPAGNLVPEALTTLKRGGTLAIAGIHLSPIPPLLYEKHLFYEKNLRSVTANTREDGKELLEKAIDIGVRTQITTYDLSQANQALLDLKRDQISGTGVLVMNSYSK
ncbi:MAG: zinc-dependent alcohol dehydrogenase family protein [Pseudobdellovibrionaceae bacterium]